MQDINEIIKECDNDNILLNNLKGMYYIFGMMNGVSEEELDEKLQDMNNNEIAILSMFDLIVNVLIKNKNATLNTTLNDESTESI